jgi:hypothetical protein
VIASYCALANRLEVKLKKTWLSKHFCGRCLVDAVLYPSDLLKVIFTYKAVFGATPNLLRPRTFNEKLQQSKLIHRRRRYSQYADKVLVRDYVARTIGPQYLNDIYWVGDDLAEAGRLDLPGKFVIKANNGSGNNILVRDAGNFDWDSACRTTQSWLAKDHSIYFAEWQYRWIKPKLLIEAFLEDPETGEIPVDYKFFVFHGRAEMIGVNFDHLGANTRAYYDREFRLLPVYRAEYAHHPSEHSKPKALSELIKIAEKLASQERFIRIDLYDVGRPIFGEMTLHPHAGMGVWRPPEWEHKLGSLMR